MRKLHKTLLLIFLMSLGCRAAEAQRLGWEVSAFGFFDNSEGDNIYRIADTYGGFRLQPSLSLTAPNGKHKVVGGYDALLEYGRKPRLDTDGLVGYYQYQDPRVRFLLGRYPRRLQRESMRDYLLTDSMRYFRTNMTGFDVLVSRPSGYVELFLDWTFKRDSMVREQFMAGALTRFHYGCFQIGMNGYYYHYANELPGKYAFEHGVHDNLLAHPYVGLSKRQAAGVLDSLDVRAGVLLNLDRDRATDGKWHTAAGFLGEADVFWKRIVLSQLLYLGKRQQYYGEEGFGKYYWGDAYYRSPWYARTDLSYIFLADKYVSLRCGVVFHFADKVTRWNQLLTLSVRMGH